MNSETHQLIRRTIIRHTGLPASGLHARLRLDADLDLTPLELVLIALEIEEAVGMAISVDGLESVDTVADLMRYFRRALSAARHSGSLRSVA
jgi:acyl carrier protein